MDPDTDHPEYVEEDPEDAGAQPDVEEEEAQDTVSAESETKRKQLRRRGVSNAGGRGSQRTPRRGSILTESESTKKSNNSSAMNKAAKRNQLDGRHRHIIGIVAQQLGLSATVVEDAILVGTQIDHFEDFFKANGTSKLLIFHQEAENSRPVTGHRAKARQIFVTTGKKEGLKGTCIVFLRPNANRAISPANMHAEIVYGLEVQSKDGGILESLENSLSRFLLPALKAQENWGELSRKKNGILVEFLEQVSKFVEVLSEARSSLTESVRLKDPEGIDVNAFTKMQDYVSAATNPETVAAVEDIVANWCKQIEQVLAESEQMRKEADDIGPKAELEHWKSRMAKFNSLLDQIKNQNCKVVVGILHASKSRLLKGWKDLDNRITDAANEAKDNVKYLYTLDKFCEPLYKETPVEMVDAIPGLINSIKMIYSISRYYNTSERMTSLFVKITNQMISACKNYIYKDEFKIFDQPRPALIRKLRESNNLNQEYQKCFQRVKAKLQANPSERQFDFSEMYIFGKYDTFCKRIQKIEDMLNTIEKFSALGRSGIEGLEPIMDRFQSVIGAMKKKPYDILDHRKMDFDGDYEDFNTKIEALEVKLQNFMDSCFERITSTDKALNLLLRFSSIENLQLDLEDKFMKTFLHYGRDLEQTRKTYQRNKDHPPTQRNLPPVAGAVNWARQLYRRIEYPMTIFKTRPALLHSLEARKIVRNYNKLAAVLVEFEVLFHRGWYRMVDAAQTGLHASLLVRHSETGQLFVNCDPQIIQLIRETKCMQRMNLDIPEAAKLLCMQENTIKKNFNELGYMLLEYRKVMNRIPPIFRSLMRPMIEQVDAAIEPGVTMLSWTSLNLNNYLEKIYASLRNLEEITNKMMDITECRIDSGLNEIASANLCRIPGDEPWTVEEFLSATDTHCSKVAKSLERQSQLVELAVNDLVSTLQGHMTPEEWEELEPECKELLVHFSQRNIEALTKCTRSSLDAIKRRLASGGDKYGSRGSRDVNVQPPFFKAKIALMIPHVVAQPGLDDIQQALNKAAVSILNVSKGVYHWNQERLGLDEGAAENLRNYFTEVSSNKEVVKIIMMLTSTINSVKKDVVVLLDGYSKYNILWQQDREECMIEFLEQKPVLADFEMEINKYERVEQEIIGLPSQHLVGTVELDAMPITQALTAETKAWKQVFGQKLNVKVRADMDDVMSFVTDATKRLSQNIKDLDDVRKVMDTLREVRESEIRIDMSISPIEESYAMLLRFNVQVSKEEAEKVDTLRYSWRKLVDQASEVQDKLIVLQADFKSDLFSSVSQLVDSVGVFSDEYDRDGPMQPGIMPREASERVQVYQRHFDELYRKYETYSAGEELFGLTVTEYPLLQKIKKELRLLNNLYGLYNEVIDNVNGYYDILWSELDLESINSDLQEYQNKCRKLPKALKEWEAYLELKKTIDDFCDTLPLLEMMAHKAMLPRHWEQVATITNHEFRINDESFYLRNIMEAPLLANREDIEEICIAAVKEKDIEGKLNAVMQDWHSQEFSFQNFKSRGQLLLKGQETVDIVTLMEDSLMVLGSLMSNRYNAPFKPTIQSWVQKLTQASEIIESWLIVQNLWVYLEAVFVGGDIAKQLPKEAKRFANIDKSWVKVMTRAVDTPNVITCTVGDETLSQILPHLTEQLELCQKSLSGYLESKRALFPRFYFVSDPALLEILGQASNSHTIQNHLLSVFDNIKHVDFDEKVYDQIYGMSSREGENVPLCKPMLAQGNVEIWLGTLLKIMQLTVNGIIRDASVAIAEMPLADFLETYIAQVGLLGLQMIWTRDSEEALSNAKSDKKVMSNVNQHFLDILNQLIDMTLRDLSKMERTKYETLVTIQVHQRDVFDALVKQHIKSAQDFEWLKQARFYWRDDRDTCIVSITDVDFAYQNEFLGCNDRLVITPLTDRCYITLAQALGMSLGGAPAGPAGTGKTETTKDMGKALGKMVVVFNCSDQMDYRGLGRIYKGLSQAGCWGCFDEFNRIELPVLSVAAQQIACVLAAKKERKTEFMFTDGEKVEMNPEFGLFLTMNPGYAGRQELPENLKVSFRTVAMMVPDREIIIRVKLASVGFQTNLVLSKKFYTLYSLCEEQLSKQIHYDFGLRNILSVLRTAGAVKRANPEDTETMIMMRVLRDMNLSKLIDEDEPLFLSLINDIFPGLNLPKMQHPEVESAIKMQVEQAGLIHHTPWVGKVIQLYETTLVRHGIVALGPSGAGKTQCIRTLMRALTDCGNPHKEFRMNPKAITAPQMFGRLDVTTNDWTDGIFSTLWRKTLKAKKTDHIWIVLDGPVDSLWIENLNSVLDDNKTLTLANGDRIPMSPTCKLVFEVSSLDNASPATVSRNGMIFMSSSVLDWSPILQAWLNNRSATENATLRNLFDNSFAEVLQYVTLNLRPKMQVLEINVIQQCIDVLTGLLTEENTPKDVISRHYCFALLWSVGALLELDDRKRVHDFIAKNLPSLPLPEIEEDSKDTYYEYVVGESGQWEHWSTRVPLYEYPTDHDPDFDSIIVPMVDNQRTEFLIDTVAKQGKGVLLIGEQGTAKTITIKSHLSKYDPEMHLFKSMSFSSATTPNLYQRTIESYVDKRVGTTFGPPAGKKMTVFIDDVNMPEINDWGDQITNEIVRQLMEQRGLYSLDKPGDFTNIVDMQFIAAMIHPGGGRNDIPSRLKRHFSIFNCTLPSDVSIDKIYETIICGHFCAARGFSEDVQAIATKIVGITRALWQQTKIKMLPTPAKFHYVFNLRDLSAVTQGMLRCTSEVVTSKSDIMRLWKHECQRVFPDRFTNAADVAWFNKALIKVVAKYEEFDEEFVEALKEDSYFVDFMRDAPEVAENEDGTPSEEEPEVPKIYEPIESLDVLQARLEHYMRLYNEAIRGNPFDLVFFKDAMTHLVKVSRILRLPGGNALLVGVGGSGKQSLTRLASFIAGYKTFQITLTRTYSETNLLEDLKELYKLAGQQGQGVSFIFTDAEVKDEGFLEFINNILTSGEVSGLLARDEVDEITSELRPIMREKAPGMVDTRENLYSFFLQRVRQNLHVVLCFSPVGEKFRNRALKFPGLISGCTMDWFNRWPKDALVAVADKFLSDMDITCTAKVKEEIVHHLGFVQDDVAYTCEDYFQRYRRQTYVTPKSYLSFINSYRMVYAEKRTDIGQLAERMNMGLNKLIEATASVAELQKELVVKEADLEVASKIADGVLAEVLEGTQAAEKVKDAVGKKKEKAEKIVNVINTDKTVAEEQLEAARPALEEAEKALDQIKPAHIATVRKLGKPPHLIMRIMDCVLLLRGLPVNPTEPDPEKPSVKPSWGEALKVMSKSDFLASLQNFRKDEINEETCELMAPYLEAEDFTVDSAKKVCGDVAGLAAWVRAMAFFFTINKTVLPLKANLVLQEHRLNGAMESLNEAQAELDARQKELDVFKAKYDAALSEKQSLQDSADTCRRKMSSATALISGLGGERERWTKQSKEFQEQIGRLAGDCLLACAFLSYTGPFNQEFRTQLVGRWMKDMKKRGIPFSSDFDVINLMVDDTILGEWRIQGLPNDELSSQNGIIVTKATRYPLLIDPQNQGVTWIKSREAPNQLQVTNLNSKWFRTHLEDALSLGRPLLIEDIGEELDPVLDNVLEKNFIKSGRTLKVTIGDKEVEVMDGFYLYITTKLSNPRYTPEVSAKACIIDFTVTIKGLEDQLLGRVILTEKQELESERKELLKAVNQNIKQMKELEDNLLLRLTSTQGSLVDDESLIEVLGITKATALEVKEKLGVASETEKKINTAREEYRPVATRGSILYFLIVNMSMVNCMYQTSLKQFLMLFDEAMAKSATSPIPTKRIENIIEYCTYNVFLYTARGLYEDHKFLFVMLLALTIDMDKKAISHEEFQCLIKGGAALDMNTVQKKPFNWIRDMAWLNLVALSKIGRFSEVLNQITRNEKGWKSWYDKDAPELAQIPDGYQNSLDSFSRLMLVRAWCPDRTVFSARTYIASSMGDKYAEAVILDMEKMYHESDPRTPLINFLSMGADPTALIESLSKQYKITMKAISMGQGQEVHARRLMTTCMASGGWVCLQNCHLGLNFLDELQEMVNTTEEVNENFRLWMTTEEHPSFPINLLQQCIKFTNEPPQGVKAGLLRTYQGISQDTLDVSVLPQWRPMLYTLSFLHTTVQERRKFGPLGWCIPYEFNLSDFAASVQFVQNHLDDVDPKKGVSWNTVRYMIGRAQYGGRVTDDFDARLLQCYCREWFGENMFGEDFNFFKGYVVPTFKTVEEYKAYIEQLPLTDSPEVFGLHPNADITYQTNMARAVLDTIVNIQPKDSAGTGGETRESVVTRQADDFLEKLPVDFIPHEVKQGLNKQGGMTPLNVCLRQEIDRLQRVISLVRETLKDLKLAIDGTIIMSDRLRNALDCIYDARVPSAWEDVSWPSSTLGFWFSDLLARHEQLKAWVSTGRPLVFWLTGFFNPQGFLTAMRQEITRAHKGWALDNVKVQTDVLKQMKEDVTTAPQEGVYIHGLFLEGASWHRSGAKLAECLPKVLFTPMPVIHVSAVNSNAPKDPRLYECPVYRKPRRTDLNYVFVVDLKTTQSPDHWILRGVALLCDVK